MRWMSSSKGRWRRIGLLALIGLILLLSLAACSGSGNLPTQAAATQAPVGVGETEAVTPPEGDPGGEPSDTEETAVIAIPTETDGAALPEETPATGEIATEAAAPLPVRAELEATDPSTVQLASGGVQLVEFFAFW